MPMVGVTSNRNVEDGVHRDWVRARYVEALTTVSCVEAVILPTGLSNSGYEHVLKRLDGVVLTGDESNIDPTLYGQCVAHTDDDPHLALRDPQRDQLAFQVIASALRLQMPILGICRGLQEMNVHCGGTLCQDLERRERSLRHHEDLSLSRDLQYRPVHPVNLSENGLLREIFGATRIEVNSLHRQGIEKVGANVIVEAMAEDGLVEAIRIGDKKLFQLGVQWHPEWHALTDHISRQLLERFGQACTAYSLMSRNRKSLAE